MIELRRFCAFLLVFAAAACDESPGHGRSEEETGPAPGDDSGQSESVSEELDVDAGEEDAEPDAEADAEILPDADDLQDEDAGEPVKHDSFETALRIEADGPTVLTDERTADQVDYFVFSGEAGTFYELSTNRGTFSPDNLISLYDSNRQLLAENDVGWIWPGDTLDVRLVVRLPATGDYFVRIEDLFTPPEFFQESTGIGTLLYYVLRVRAISADTEGYAFADAASASVRLLKDEASGYEFITLLGQFDADADLIPFSGVADDLLVGHIHPGGPSGSGSTARGGRVRVSAGDHMLAEIDRTKGQEFIRPPVTAGGHQLSISADGPLGDNPFYAFDLVLLPDNPREQSEAANGSLAGAEPIVFTGRGRRRGLLSVTLAPGDTDYFRFDAASGQVVAIGCEAESAGSGVRGLSAELRDAADSVLASAAESTTVNLQLPVVRIGAAGTYYLRLSSESAEPAPAIEPWTRCSMTVY